LVLETMSEKCTTQKKLDELDELDDEQNKQR
jgi:hypothetical protein